MDLVEVEITGMVITSRYGTLQSGAILRTDKEFADHLVNDCAAAKYTKPKSDPAASQTAAEADKTPVDAPADPEVAPVEAAAAAPAVIEAVPAVTTRKK